MRFNLPSQVEYILATLEGAGYQAHIVGGSVRDLLLGKNPDDFDITTSALPEETKAVFSDKRTVDTGIKHGTVSLILDGKAYEITTYRLDGEYKDSRHPEAVYFTNNIEEDLSRRDFTVNAMAYNRSNGLVDPFGGRDDLERKIIRAVGDADLRFSEDALRILRGIRFSAVLGFDIDEFTSSAIHRKAHLLKNVSAERIFVELKKMLSADYSYELILEYSDVLLTVIPSLNWIYLPDKEAFSSADFLSRIASIFYFSSNNPPKAFAEFCHDMHTDSALRDRGYAILSSVGRYDLTDVVSLKHLLHDLGEAGARELISLEIALGKASPLSFSYLDALVSSKVCYRLSDLEVGGSDILALGVMGKRVGEILDSLLTAVIENKIPNDRDTLIYYAKELI